MSNLRNNLQLVDGGQYLEEEGIETLTYEMKELLFRRTCYTIKER
jgi:hypothetical protein